jgi:hypothetical protein
MIAGQLQTAKHPARIQSIRLVHCGMAVERLNTVQAFYGDAIGLRAWPGPDQDPGGWGAGTPRRGIYFAFRHDPTVDPVRRRFTILVPSLDEIEQRLEAMQSPYRRRRGLGYADDVIFTSDPSGHVVELRQERTL